MLRTADRGAVPFQENVSRLQQRGARFILNTGHDSTVVHPNGGRRKTCAIDDGGDVAGANDHHQQIQRCEANGVLKMMIHIGYGVSWTAHGAQFNGKKQGAGQRCSSALRQWAYYFTRIILRIISCRYPLTEDKLKR